LSRWLLSHSVKMVRRRSHSLIFGLQKFAAAARIFCNCLRETTMVGAPSQHVEKGPII
jgi:hypothetical protein